MLFRELDNITNLSCVCLRYQWLQHSHRPADFAFSMACNLVESRGLPNLDIDIISHAIKLQRHLQGDGLTWRSMEPEMDRCQSLVALR